MFNFNKEQFMLSLKSDFGKSLEPVSKNLSTILMVGSIITMGYGAVKMWTAVPEAQKAIEEKRERDNSITKLEAAAVAAPYMAVPIIAFGSAAGMMIGSDYISRSRLAATTTLLAAAVADKKKWQEKFEQYTSKEKLQQAKKEIFEEQHNAKVVSVDDDNVIEGYDATNDSVRAKNNLQLNRMYRCILEDNREFYNTPMKIAETEKYIRQTYGANHKNEWHGKSFSLNDVMLLLGVDYGRIGQEEGYSPSQALDFTIGMTPAIDTKTGEIFLYVELPDRDPDWNLPFK